MILLFFCLSFLSTRKFNTPTDFVVEFVRFLCFKSDFIWLLIFFFLGCSRVDATEKDSRGRDSERAPSSGTRSRHIQNERAKRSHVAENRHTIFLSVLSVCLLVFFYFTLFYFIFLSSKIPRAHFLSSFFPSSIVPFHFGFFIFEILSCFFVVAVVSIFFFKRNRWLLFGYVHVANSVSTPRKLARKS